MRIFEIMSFDPSWFLTIPGLLISGGVLLLLIALIVFIATSKKEKGANVDPTVEGSIPLVEGPDNMNNGVGVDASNNMNASYPNSMPMDNMAGMGVVSNPNINTMGMSGANNTFNQMGGVNEIPAMPDYNMNNINNNPMQAPIEPVIEEPQPVQASSAMPEANIPTPDVPVMPTNTNIEFSGVPGVTISDTVNPEMQPVIDLGSVSPNPVVDFSAPNTPNVEPVAPEPINNVAQSVNRPIYGGANPLENTSSIPTVTNHSAYNGEPIIPNSVMNEVNVVDNTPTVNVETPAMVNNQTTPVSAADIFNTNIGAQQPEVIAQPTPVVENSQPVNSPVQPTDAGIETLNF